MFLFKEETSKMKENAGNGSDNHLSNYDTKTIILLSRVNIVEKLLNVDLKGKAF